MESKLSPLQVRILDALRGIEPTWTLRAGAALAGFHLGHRVTRDLDLFFHGSSDLGDTPPTLRSRMRNGPSSESLRSTDESRRRGRGKRDQWAQWR